jgi:hypothetical protein
MGRTCPDDVIVMLTPTAIQYASCPWCLPECHHRPSSFLSAAAAREGGARDGCEEDGMDLRSAVVGNNTRNEVFAVSPAGDY